MTPEEWECGGYAYAMWDWLQQRGMLSERKARLFGAACCRRVWHLTTDDRFRRAVEVAEEYADWRGTGEQLREAHDAAWRASLTLARLGEHRWNAEQVSAYHAASAGAWVASEEADAMWDASTESSKVARAAAYTQPEWEFTDRDPERTEQAGLVRDIFRNPFRPPPVISAEWLQWNDRTVSRLAEAAYEERFMPSGILDRQRLAVLADALCDAGCDDAELLGHLRGPAAHYRGCWAVDALLGKE